MIPGEYYTLESLFTLAGSAAFVWMATNIIGYAVMPRKTEYFRRWLGLFLSLVLAVLGATRVPMQTPLIWVVAIANGFLIYTTAVGVSAIVEGATAGSKTTHPFVEETGHRRPKRVLISPWW